MKRFLSLEPGGGVPITNELLYTLQSEPLEATSILLSTVSTNWVVDGCQVSKVNLSGRTCSLSGGYVYLNSELRGLDAVTSTYPLYIISAPDSYDQKQFSNGAFQNYLVNKKAMTTTVKPTSGQYLTVDPSQLGGDDTVTKRLRPLLNADLTATLNAEIQNRTSADQALTKALVDEAQVRADADTQLQNNINTLAAKVNLKQDRIRPRIPWQDVGITNPYYSSTENLNDTNTSGMLGTKFGKFQIMRDEDGLVHLRGYLLGNGGGTVVSQNGLPKEFWPSSTVQFNVAYCADGGTAYPGRVMVFHTIEVDAFGGIMHQVTYSQTVSANDPGAQKLQKIHPFLLVDGFSYSVE